MILDGGVVLKKINLLLFVMVVCSVIVLAADPVNVKISVPSSITKNVPFDIDVTLDSTDQSVTAIVLYVTSQEGKVTFNSANRDGPVWFSGKEPGQNMLVTVGGKSMWYFKLGPFGSTTETSNVDKKIFTLKATASEDDTILIYNPNSESKIFKGINKYQMIIVPAVVTLAGLECVPTCPSPSTVCKGVTDTLFDDKCKVNCNVKGTKTTGECLDTTSACPNLPPDKITEEGSCNVIGDFNGDNNVDSQDISTIKNSPLLFWKKITEGIESLQKFVSSMITNLESK